MIGIEIDQINRNEHTNRVNPLGRNHPDSLVGLQTKSAYESPQAREMSVGRSHTQAQEGLTSLIKDAVALLWYFLAAFCCQFHLPPG